MTSAYRKYKNSFEGLSREVWLLALVSFINRAGTMVVPFLSLYLTEDLNFSLEDVGWIMSAFGAGSVLGAWIGGKLTDQIGFRSVMLWSLIASGLVFIGLQYIHDFWEFCLGVFVLMTISDAFRPALYVALNTYSRPENRTRSVTLIRLAINLGFSFGPAAGGFIITTMGYSGLFWVDGITCISAALLFMYVLDARKAKEDTEANGNGKKQHTSPYRDGPYLLFLFIILLIGFTFLQYFSTIPLYYRDVYELSEDYIGWLMAINGALIFIIEMPLIKFFERPQFSMYRILFVSALMIAASFAVLDLGHWIGWLWVGILLMTFGEMLNFPFLNRFAMDRAERGKSGEYMALFTMAFSVAHIVSHNAGMQLVNHVGFEVTWSIMTGILVIAAVLIVWLRIIVKREQEAESETEAE